MRRRSILADLRKINRRVFTTREVSISSGKSLSTVTQSLKHLARERYITKLYRGIWAREEGGNLSPYAIMPHLFPRHRAYVSFISALHLYGIVEQIPQVTTLASTTHAKTIRTKVGTFQLHRIAPSFFAGFKWYKQNGDFLIAEPEKALVDSLYLSSYKKKRFGHFPELHFPASFSLKKAGRWAGKIPSPAVRAHVKKRLEEFTMSGISS